MRSRLACGLLLLASAVTACRGTDDEYEGAAADTTQAGTQAASHDCRTGMPGPFEPAPASIAGTWFLESFDEPSTTPSIHYTVSRENPLLVVTFAADGTWRAARCMGAGETYSFATCSAECATAPELTTGTYTYVNGELESQVANYGTQAVYKTPQGISIAHFWGTNGYANFLPAEPPFDAVH